MRKHQLSYKLIRYVIPLVIAPLLVLGGFTLINSNLSAKKQSELVVKHNVAQNKQKIDSIISVYGQTLGLLSRSPILERLITTPVQSSFYESRLGDLLAVFSSYTEAYPEIASVELISNTGDNIAFYSADLFSESQASYIKPTLDSIMNEQQVLVLNQGSAFNIHYIQKIHQVDFDTNDVILWGYVAINLQPALLFQSINDKLFDDAVNLLYTDSGRVFQSSQSEFMNVQLSPTELSELLAIEKSGNASSEVLNFLGAERYVHFSTRLTDDMHYFSGVPYNKLYNDAQNITLFALLLLVVSIFTIPTVIFIILRKLLVWPVEELSRASKKIGKGEFDLQFEFASEDELGDLFNEFRVMATRLKNYQTQVERYQYSMEQQVTARTEDLHTANAQLKQAIVEADNANQMKSRFLANMSHEIRTPLTAIIGFTEQLLIEECTKEEREKNISTVLRNSSHLLGLINNILDLSKIEAEKLELEYKTLSLFTVLMDIEPVIAVCAKDKELEFTINYDFPLPDVIKSDAMRIKQILLNLCSNAVKFTMEGKVDVNVKAQPQTGHIIIQVIDTGIGMSSDELDKIFNPFEQADTSTTRNFGGTGLGLCISKRLAVLLGGNITVQSAKGIGSHFEVTLNIGMPLSDINWLDELPLIESDHYQQNKRISEATAAHILVAEDNQDNQRLVKLLLEKRGFTVDIVDNGSLAVEAALTNDYDLVLMDMQMPVMGGLEATQMLRTMGFEAPVIALTANIMKDEIALYKEQGCNATVAKPIDQQDLFNAINHTLGELNDDVELIDMSQSIEYQQLTQAFIKALPALIDEIIQAYTDEKWEQCQARAHSLKGSAGGFGYPKMTQIAALIESALKEQNTQLLEPQITALKMELQQFTHAVIT